MKRKNTTVPARGTLLYPQHNVMHTTNPLHRPPLSSSTNRRDTREWGRPHPALVPQRQAFTEAHALQYSIISPPFHPTCIPRNKLHDNESRDTPQVLSSGEDNINLKYAFDDVAGALKEASFITR